MLTHSPTTGVRRAGGHNARVVDSYEPRAQVWLRRWRRWRGAPAAFATSWFDARRHAADFANIETYSMFLGYPRSGHSLVGSLVSAHPEAVIADELDVLRYIQLGFRRRQIYALILRSDAGFQARGRQSYVHNYNVPGSHQGRYTSLRVIGDKKGGASTLHLLLHPEWMERLERVVQDPVRYIHVTRNSYDNVAAMFNMPTWGGTLDQAVDRYLLLCEGVADQKRRIPPQRMFDLRHEDLLIDPRGRLTELCTFLGLEADEAYLDACASILYESPNKTRFNAPWADESRQRVTDAIERYPFLRGYGWDD